MKSQIQSLLNNNELFNVSNLSTTAKATIDKLEEKLGPLIMSLSPETQTKLKELKEQVNSGIDSVSSEQVQKGGALQRRISKSIDEFRRTNSNTATKKRINKHIKTKKGRR